MTIGFVMINNKNIDLVMLQIKKQVKTFDTPYVTQLSLKKNPFKLLISTILSSRTRDNITEQVIKKLFSKISTPQDLLKLSEEEIQKLIYPIGFYRVKAKNLKKMVRMLISEYNSKIPQTIEELIKLPGVGRKTANLVVTLGFDKNGICVDTHVHRIVNRWGYISTKTPFETEFMLRKKLNKIYWKKFNPLLVIFGQNICKPISPKCEFCNLNKICPKKL
jgi:endonuclease-3